MDIMEVNRTGAETDKTKITDRKLIYIAGPYRAPTINGIYNNICRARKRAEWAWSNGYIPICPHTNSAFTDGVVSDEIILTGCLKMLSVCEVVLMVDGWLDSTGAKAEWALAVELGLTILEDPLRFPRKERGNEL